MTSLPRIVIHTDRDLTPAGKRTARMVTLRQGLRIRWYVGGRIYMTRPAGDVVITKEWIAAGA